MAQINELKQELATDDWEKYYLNYRDNYEHTFKTFGLAAVKPKSLLTKIS